MNHNDFKALTQKARAFSTALDNRDAQEREMQAARLAAINQNAMQSRPYTVDEQAFGVAREQAPTLPNPFDSWQPPETNLSYAYAPDTGRVRQRREAQMEAFKAKQLGPVQMVTQDRRLIDGALARIRGQNVRYDTALSNLTAQANQAAQNTAWGIVDQGAETAVANAQKVFDKIDADWYASRREALEMLGEQPAAQIRKLAEAEQGYKAGTAPEVYLALREQLENAYGAELLDSLLEYVRMEENAERMENAREEAYQRGQKSGWFSLRNVGTVPQKLVGGVVGTAEALGQGLVNAVTGNNRPLDLNTPAQEATARADAFRSGAQEDMSGVGRFVYGTAMSLADSGVAILTGQPWILGTAAANSTMQEVKRNGGSESQALTMGVIVGVTEMLTEKLSIDSLFQLSDAKTVKDMLWNAVKQALPEAAEETVSSVVNLLADDVVMGEKSRYNQLIASGMTDKQAFLELAKEVGLNALGGGLSGFVMGSGKSAVDLAANPNTQTEAAEQTEAPKAAEPAQAEETEIQGIMKKILEMPRINNTVANMIIQDPEAAAEFEKQTGVQLTGTTEQKRQTIKDTVRDMRRQPVEAVEAHEQTATPQTAEPAQAAQAVTPEQKPEAQPVQTPKTTAQIMEEAARGMVGKPENILDEEALPAMGAADAGFTGDIGAWKWDTEDTIKNTQLPKTDKSGNFISDTAGSLFEANVPRETKEAVERYAYEGEFSYGPLANNQVVEEVHRELERDGFDMVYGQVTSDLMNRKASPYTTAKAWVLYVQSANRGLDDKAAMLSKLLANYNTDVARALQINSIYSKLTPEGRFAAIQRVVDGLNNEILSSNTAQSGQSGANQEQAVSAETKEAVTSAMDDAYDTALRLLPNIHEAFQREPSKSKTMDFEAWRMKIAKNVAKAIEGAKAPPTMTVSKMIQQDILRFAKDYLPKQARQKSRTAVDTLKQYFEHPDWYQDAWKKAQNIVRANHEGDMDVPEFATATMMFNGTGSDPVMVKAITEMAIQENLKKRNISYTAFLGDGERLANQLSDELIQQTGATGSNAQQIREACLRYVNELGLENTKTNERLVNREAAAALKMFGLQVSDLIRIHPGDRTMIVEGIADILVEDYGVAESAAKSVSSKIADIFGNAVADRAKKAVKAIVDASGNQKAKKTLSDKFREMANMGVFLDPEASRIVTNKLFGAPVQIDERLQQEYFQAKTPEEIAAAEKKIYASIGRQIPSTGADKWNAWRYMSMLGNLKTPLRDTFGNATHAGMRAVRDAVSSGVEAISQKAGWIDQKDRTKAILTPKDRELLNAAKADYENVAGYIMDGDKWNTAPDEISRNQRVYKNGVLEAARVGLDKFGKWRDKPFAQGAYAKALAGYLKAQGFSAQDFTGKRMTPQQKEAARSYAIKEAQEATFRQVNDFSQWVSRIGQKRSGKNDSKTLQALDTFGHTLVEGQMPFKRTPANILVTGAVDYSPAGLVKTIVFDSRKVKRGEMTPAQYISNLSSGLTGTAITGLGYLLADLGIITGGTPEDEEQFELEGRRAYSLQIGGKSISLAWLAPVSMPLFLGVAIHDLFAKEKKNVPAMDKVLGALQGLTEPILETSMMSGLQEALESVEWADNKIGAFVGNAMLSYIKQAFPTVFGHIERVFEPSYRETTFTQDGDRILNKDAQYALGNIGNKVPFADYQQIPYIDAWGRTQSEGGTAEKVFNSLFNPAYVSDIRETDVDKEIKRLEKVTGENYTPSRAGKTITINKTDYLLTADEYLTYATAKGQNDFTIRTNAMDSENYELLTDAMKGKVHEYSEELANYLAKKEAGFDDPNAAKWMVELSEADAETVTKAIIKKAVENIGGLGKPIKFDASWAVVSGDVMDGAMKKAQAYADAVALEEMGYPMETDWMLKAKEAKTDKERQDLFMAEAVDAQAKKLGDGKKYVGLSEMLEDGDVDDKVALLVLPPDVVKRKTDRKIKVSATLLVDALAFKNSDAASSGKKDKNGKDLDGEGPQDKVLEYLRKDRRLPTSQVNKVMACLYEGWDY